MSEKISRPITNSAEKTFTLITFPFYLSLSLKFPSETKDKIKEEQRYRCDICERQFEPSGLKIHHKIPRRSKKSSNGRENGVALCEYCHLWADYYLDQGIEYETAKETIRQRNLSM
ncbi:HNH endonuclease [Candidatus Roizmanbacteria bacterium]|nr:HNH endonuclease [Candidatus Roizmanbacteria bacterium]